MEHKNVMGFPAFFLERTDARTHGAAGAGVHYHRRFELYYLVEGSCWYFIDKKSYHLTAGDIALIPEGVLHRTSYETPEHTRLLLQFDASFVPESVRETVDTHPYFSPRDATVIEKTRRLLGRMESEYAAPDRFSEDALRCLLGELFLLIARTGGEEDSKRESPIVERAVQFIRTHYTEDIGLTETATHCFVCKEHLSRVFRRETGFGFCEFLRAYRLKKAESLLRSAGKKMKVADVAFACGFNDSNYFAKIYRRTYGRTPTLEKRTGRVAADDLTFYINDAET